MSGRYKRSCVDRGRSAVGARHMSAIDCRVSRQAAAAILAAVAAVAAPRALCPQVSINRCERWRGAGAADSCCEQLTAAVAGPSPLKHELDPTPLAPRLWPTLRRDAEISGSGTQPKLKCCFTILRRQITVTTTKLLRTCYETTTQVLLRNYYESE